MKTGSTGDQCVEGWPLAALLKAASCLRVLAGPPATDQAGARKVGR